MEMKVVFHLLERMTPGMDSHQLLERADTGQLVQEDIQLVEAHILRGVEHTQMEEGRNPLEVAHIQPGVEGTQGLGDNPLEGVDIDQQSWEDIPRKRLGIVACRNHDHHQFLQTSYASQQIH